MTFDTVTALASAHLPARLSDLPRIVWTSPLLNANDRDRATRAQIAHALNILLLADLIDRTPTAAAYVKDLRASGDPLTFDHGALRTIDLDGMGALPRGRAAITRVLEPLGYRQTAIYPLDRLGMTGYSYAQQDLPEDIPQFFVSELHVDRFSPAFREAMKHVTGYSRDPLGGEAIDLLSKLASDGELTAAEATALLPRLAACFGRQHADPAIADYEQLLAESGEAAWIATEGNSFNHATHRVDDLNRLVGEQRALGRPMKPEIEISKSGRIRQTAYKADPVERRFVDRNGQPTSRTVPGSFFEFIQRASVTDETGRQMLDLGFDSSNAQAIFKMTAA